MLMDSAFEYQLEILKAEIEHINSSIIQMDEMTKSIKDWAIVTWTACLGAALTIESLHPLIGLTTIIPLTFWIVDAQYRNIQRRFIFRIDQISHFLNDERLRQSFDEKRLVNFQVLDPTAKKSRGHLLYKQQVNLSRTLRFKSVYFLYLALMMISIFVHLIFYKFID